MTRLAEPNQPSLLFRVSFEASFLIASNIFSKVPPAVSLELSAEVSSSACLGLFLIIVLTKGISNLHGIGYSKTYSTSSSFNGRGAR